MDKSCCVLCKHFHFEEGMLGYSSWTPGFDCALHCTAGHYNEQLDRRMTEIRYKELMQMSKDCPDFEQRSAS